MATQITPGMILAHKTVHSIHPLTIQVVRVGSPHRDSVLFRDAAGNRWYTTLEALRLATPLAELPAGWRR